MESKETELTKLKREQRMAEGKRGAGRELDEGDLRHLTSFFKIEHSVWESSSSREIEVNMAGATKDMKVTTFVVLVENKVWKQGGRLASQWST